MTETSGPNLRYFVDLAARAMLIAFLAVIGTTKVMGFVASWRSEHFSALDGAGQAASLAFVVLAIFLILIRTTPLRYSEGWEPGLSALAGTLFPMLLIALPLPDAPPAARIIGLIAIACGWALSIYVLSWLGRSFSVMPQARQLVTGGPYSIVRHPLYLTEELAFLGLVLLYFTPTALLIAVVHWLFQLRRMTNEEKVLRATWPEYAAYAARTPRIIPRVFHLFSRAREA